jgi:putative transposase
MSRYLRSHIPGASVFFTVALACRGADILTRPVADLRAAVRATKAERPFAIDAWVVLPDHMHCVWTLPEGGEVRRTEGPRKRSGGPFSAPNDCSARMGAIKARFTRSMRRVGFHPTDTEIVDGASARWTPTPR